MWWSRARHSVIRSSRVGCTVAGSMVRENGSQGPGMRRSTTVKIERSGITRREFGISPGHNGVIEKTRQPHSITRLKNYYQDIRRLARDSTDFTRDPSRNHRELSGGLELRYYDCLLYIYSLN